jgi:adenosylhomocysteinase
MESMRDGVVICNSGHFDVEIAVKDLAAAAIRREQLRPNCAQYTLPSGRGIILLAEGRLVGQSAAEAHPAEVMDMTFATQALGIEHLTQHAAEMKPGVHEIPHSIEQQVAKAKLASYDILIDQLSEDQRHYLTGWRIGT